MAEIKNSRQYEKRNTSDLMREKFLYKVVEIKPSVISDLANDVFPSSTSFGDLLQPRFRYLPKQLVDLVNFDYDFDKEFQLEKERQQKVRELQSDFNFEKEFESFQIRFNFQKRICLWAKKNNFFDEWILLEALATLENWKHVGITNKWTFVREIKSLPAKFYKIKEEKPFFEFHFEPFEPENETRIDYRKRLNQKFEIQLQNYLEDRESQNPNPKAFNTQKVKEETHLTWLIEHQICNLTYDKIAEKDLNGLELRKISEAITRLAKLIGLTLRNVPNRQNKLLRKK